MRIWRDPERGPWFDRWRRRGDLLITLGVTGEITWITGVVPTSGTTHVNIWPPIAAFAVFAALGVAIAYGAEVESRKLPGYKRFREDSDQRFHEGAFDMVSEGSDARAVAEAIYGLNKTLRSIEQRLPPAPDASERTSGT